MNIVSLISEIQVGNESSWYCKKKYYLLKNIYAKFFKLNIFFLSSGTFVFGNSNGS